MGGGLSAMINVAEDTPRLFGQAHAHCKNSLHALWQLRQSAVPQWQCRNRPPDALPGFPYGVPLEATLRKHRCTHIFFANDCSERSVDIAFAGIFRGGGLDPEDGAAGCAAVSSLLCPGLRSMSLLDFIIAPQVVTLGMVLDAWMSPARQPLHKAPQHTCS
jgi:hypothetical protein